MLESPKVPQYIKLNLLLFFTHSITILIIISIGNMFKNGKVLHFGIKRFMNIRILNLQWTVQSRLQTQGDHGQIHLESRLLHLSLRPSPS